VSHLPGTVLGGVGIGLNAVSAEVFRVRARKSTTQSARSGSASEETSALTAAIAKVSKELEHMAVQAESSNAEIFQALSLMIQDPELFESACRHIDKGWSAGSALFLAVEEFAQLLSGDALLEERAADLKDLATRVSAELNGVGLGMEIPLRGRVVLVGEDFFPTDVAQFGKAVVGVVTSKGGPTSHSAILLRSMGIPAVLGCDGADQLLDGQVVLVDPAGDRVMVDADMSSATQSISMIAKSFEPIVPVRANIGSLDDAVRASATAAEGVGLLRTELLYLAQHTVPSVDEQTKSYSDIFAAAPEGPVVVRTIDVSTDKPVPFLSVDPKAALTPGYSLLSDNREFVIGQLKSIERARELTGREIWVMAPMVDSASEAIEFAELARTHGHYRVGVMVETPSLANEVAKLKGKVDFVSVGTNDLSQFLFETNRLAPLSPSLLSPWQPKLIKLLGKIAKAAQAANIATGVCGESASDPVFAIVLAGLGFDSVSASMSQVGAVRSALSSVSLDEAAEVAQVALGAGSAESAKAMVLGALRRY
jgi:phosphotransferase system enzyme I (PtsI)